MLPAFRAPRLALLALAAGLALPAADPPPSPVRFSERLVKAGFAYSYGLAAADLDGDGDLDLVSADATGEALYWYENDGKGNFRTHLIAKGAGWFERLAVADIDGDGKPDVVVVKNLHGGVEWYRNSGTPRDGKPWQRFVITKNGLPGAYDVAVADVDGDGKADVIASSWVRSNQFVWFRNPGKVGPEKEWAKQVIAAGLPETRTVRVADFNRDGRPDFLGTATGAGLVAWWENPGKGGGAWKKHVIDEKANRPTHGHPVDLDGDGDLDVVMAEGFNGKGGMVVWYENVGKPGDGTRWKRHVVGDLPGAFEAAAGDLNGDGRLDVVATAWGAPGQVVWFENLGGGKWRKHLLKAPWRNANAVIVADLDGDGRPDVAATAERGANELRWWRNEGKK